VTLGRRDLVDEAVAGVLARPTRLALTALGAALGLASMVATLGLAQTAANQVAGHFDAIAATQVSVQPRTTRDPAGTGEQALSFIPWDAEQRLERLTGVLASGTISSIEAVPPTRTIAVIDPSGQGSQALPVVAVSAGLFDAVLGHVVTGRFFDQGHDARADAVVVLGVRAAARLNINRIDNAPTVFVGNRAFSVLGIVNDVVRHAELLDAVIIPAHTAQRFFGLQAPAAVQIRTSLGAGQLVGHQAPIALSPTDPTLMAASVPPSGSTLQNKVKGDINALFLVLGGVALLAGAVGIANVTLLSVMERTSEIGLRRALGATRRDIGSQFLIESGVVGFLGGLFGASSGVLVTLGVSATRAWEPVLDVRLAAGAPLLGVVIGVLAGAYPAWRACAVEPIDALRAA
jgi:putative ABC transport system permease protein